MKKNIFLFIKSCLIVLLVGFLKPVLAINTSKFEKCSVSSDAVRIQCSNSIDSKLLDHLQALLNEKTDSAVERILYLPVLVDIANKLKSNANTDDRLALRASQAIDALHQRDLSKALSFLEEVYLRKKAAPNYVLIELFKEIVVLTYLQDVNKAISLMESSSELISTDTELQIMLGMMVNQKGDYKYAESIYHDVLDQHMPKKDNNYQSFKIRQQRMYVYLLLGDLCLRQKDFSKAEQMYKISLDLVESAGNLTAIQADNNYGLGVIYLFQGEDERASKVLFDSLMINKNLARHKSMRNNYFTIGLLNKMAKNFKQAREMFVTAYGLSTQDDSVFADVLYQLGLISYAEDEPTKAIQQLLRSRGIYQILDKTADVMKVQKALDEIKLTL